MMRGERELRKSVRELEYDKQYRMAQGDYVIEVVPMKHEGTEGLGHHHQKAEIYPISE